MKRKMEWSLLLGGGSAALTAVVGFVFPDMSAETTALWIVLIQAVIALASVITTRPWAPGMFTYVIAAATALVTAYGLNWPEESVTAWTALITAVFAFIQRGQSAPAVDVKEGRVAADGVTVLQPPPPAAAA